MWFWRVFYKIGSNSNSNQEPRVVNGDITAKFFSFDRGARQGDPVSAFLFILALEVFSVLIKSSNSIRGLDIYGHNFLYTAHADDCSSFLRTKDLL